MQRPDQWTQGGEEQKHGEHAVNGLGQKGRASLESAARARRRRSPILGLKKPEEKKETAFKASFNGRGPRMDR